MLHWQDQAFPSHLLPVRQAGEQIPRIPAFRRRSHMAKMKCQHNLVSVIPAAMLLGLITPLLDIFSKWRMSTSPVGKRIRQYEKALWAYSEAQHAVEAAGVQAQRAAEQKRLEAERVRQAAERAERRKRLDYWLSLRGVRFERELADLYRQQDYQVRFTPKSGDQGIDLILTKDGKTTIVQCKGQKGPASPAVVRELYGSLYAFEGASDATLACTGGFTQGVRDFASGKPITLISAIEMAKMAERVMESQ